MKEPLTRLNLTEPVIGPRVRADPLANPPYNRDCFTNAAKEPAKSGYPVYDDLAPA